MREALLYDRFPDTTVQCHVCSHECVIKDGAFGICGVRQNQSGTLYTHAYGSLIATNIDPIEKKPLYHFLPGTKSFSIATIGCNFRCGFCQNWQISQMSFRNDQRQQGDQAVPADVVNAALRSGCKSIAYTYTEPTIFIEYALDTARLAQKQGLRNVFVTNGFMTGQVIDMMTGLIDAANVDLKFFRDDSYRRICNGSLQPVLDSIQYMHTKGIWIELTTLIIPGENDGKQELTDIAAFIAGVDRNIPWHVSRFHSDYKFDSYGSTPEQTLRMAVDIGNAAGLRYVYAGNVNGWGNDTMCPGCKKLVIGRSGFNVTENHIEHNTCSYCREKVAGIFINHDD